MEFLLTKRLKNQKSKHKIQSLKSLIEVFLFHKKIKSGFAKIKEKLISTEKKMRKVLSKKGKKKEKEIRKKSGKKKIIWKKLGKKSGKMGWKFGEKKYFRKKWIN